ncbi:MAG: hypothetical protein CVU65_05450 [Deltaproteobacteria bacterium HGW-Deltaproteobacteria-22]|jgi:hypothetical protein|nr:MAG: hypothetical protein CVU65_05450 [Deltaproteobacteria bacterium HGW-Deltaproteobacteria-22]
MKEITATATTLDGLRKAIKRVAAIISAPGDLLPTYGSSRDFGYPHIEIDHSGYHYVVVERGNELERRTTRDPHELLFWVFDSATSSMAGDFELEHRVEGQDSRRISFEKKLELLGQLDSAWQARAAEEQKAILERYPFDDVASTRAKLAKQLRDEGVPPDRAWDMACQRFPDPSNQ